MRKGAALWLKEILQSSKNLKTIIVIFINIIIEVNDEENIKNIEDNREVWNIILFY